MPHFIFTIRNACTGLFKQFDRISRAIDGHDLILRAAFSGTLRGNFTGFPLLFVGGFTAVFVAAGVLVGSAGSFFIEHERLLQQVLGGLTILLGLGFMGAVPWFQREYRDAASLMGFGHGVGEWVSCCSSPLS